MKKSNKANQKKKLWSARQGDVLIVRVDSLPVDKFERLPQGVPIKAALGEVTGHSHQVSGDISCALMRPRTNEAEPLTNFVGVGPNGAVITHEEHSAIELPPDGNYRFLIQTEHVPGEVPRNVAD